MSQMELFAFTKDYVDRLRSGDAQTELHFVAYFDQLLELKLRARMVPSEIVDDLRQETYMRVFAAARNDGIRQPERFAAYVNAVANGVLKELHQLSDQKESLNRSHIVPSHLLDIDAVPSSRSDFAGAITNPPGLWLSIMAEFFFSPKTVERVFAPIISDLQLEYCEALAADRKAKAAWVRVRGCWAFFKALGLYRVLKAVADIFLRFSSR
jgi:hypothetical protein